MQDTKNIFIPKNIKKLLILKLSFLYCYKLLNYRCSEIK